VTARLEAATNGNGTANGSASTTPQALKRPNAPQRLSSHPHQKHTTAKAMMLKILKEGGPLAFYRGFGANMLNSFSMQLCVVFVFFSLFSSESY
jgi:adenine nucleotide transporter 17